jgi:hypothetical protein
MKNNKKKSKTKNEKPQEAEIVIPPLEFSSLVLPFYTQALLSLGVEKDSKHDKDRKNLDLVKRMIDLLDLLRKRTQGNLQPEEGKFLDSCLHQLKLSYMERAKIIKL